MRISRKRKLVVAVAVVVLAIVAVGVGLGAWSLGGTGNGAAKATTASSITLADATAFTSADLYPGATGNLSDGTGLDLPWRRDNSLTRFINEIPHVGVYRAKLQHEHAIVLVFFNELSYECLFPEKRRIVEVYN